MLTFADPDPTLLFGCPPFVESPQFVAFVRDSVQSLVPLKSTLAPLSLIVTLFALFRFPGGTAPGSRAVNVELTPEGCLPFFWVLPLGFIYLKTAVYMN